MRPFLAHQLFLTQGFSEQFPPVMDAPLDGAQRQPSRTRYLGEAVPLGIVHEGVEAHRPCAQFTDDAGDVINYRPLVALVAADNVPVPQTDGLQRLKPAPGVDPQVAHDGPTPCKQRSRLVVAVAVLKRPRHCFRCEVVGTLVMAVAPRYPLEVEVHRHDVAVKVHGSLPTCHGLHFSCRRLDYPVFHTSSAAPHPGVRGLPCVIFGFLWSYSLFLCF